MRAPPSPAVPGKAASCAGSSLCPEAPTPLLGTGTRQEERLQCPGSTVPVLEPCRAGIVPPSPSLPALLLAACAGSPGISGAENWSCWKRRAGRAGTRDEQLLQGARHLPPRWHCLCGALGGDRSCVGARGGPAGQRQPQPFLVLCRAPGCALACAIPCGPGRRCLRGTGRSRVLGPCFGAVFLPWPVAARSVLIWDTRQSRLRLGQQRLITAIC